MLTAPVPYEVADPEAGAELVALCRARTECKRRNIPTQKICVDTLPLPVGRNEPCPCGSGRKLKKCCLKGKP